MIRPYIHMPSLCGSRLLGQALEQKLEDRRMDRPHELDPGGRAQGPADPGAERLKLREAGNQVLAGFELLDQLDPATVGRHVFEAGLEVEAADAANQQLRPMQLTSRATAAIENHP